MRFNGILTPGTAFLGSMGRMLQQAINTRRQYELIGDHAGRGVAAGFVIAYRAAIIVYCASRGVYSVDRAQRKIAWRSHREVS